MASKLVAMLAVLTLALPALSQEQQYAYPDDQGGWYGQPPSPPPSPPPAPPSATPQPAYDDGWGPPPESVEVSVDAGIASATFQTFRDGLAPYGEWMVTSRYGRVWRPVRVAPGWRPYYYGHWEWTDHGWLWVSDEPWGWAAYHYGRWAYEQPIGWIWIPGYQWAPAWVTWRYSPDYVGWAPLGPGFSVYATSYPAVYSWWTFVPSQRFAGVPVYSVAYTGGYARSIFHATRAAPPRAIVYGTPGPAWGGPAHPIIERRVGHAIQPVRVEPVSSPVAAHGPRQPGMLPIYRPEVRPRASNAGGHGIEAAPQPVQGFAASEAGHAPAYGAQPRGVQPGTPQQGAPVRPPQSAPPPQSAAPMRAPQPAGSAWHGPATERGGRPFHARDPAQRPAPAAHPQPGQAGQPQQDHGQPQPGHGPQPQRAGQQQQGHVAQPAHPPAANRSPPGGAPSRPAEPEHGRSVRNP